MSNCLRWLRQINLAKLLLLLPDQFTSSSAALIAISTLLITVIRHVEGLLLSLYLDSTRKLIIIINFNHSTSTLFSVQLDRVSGTRAKEERLKKMATPRKPPSQHSIQLCPLSQQLKVPSQAKFTGSVLIRCKSVYIALLGLLVVMVVCKCKWQMRMPSDTLRYKHSLPGTVKCHK